MKSRDSRLAAKIDILRGFYPVIRRLENVRRHERRKTAVKRAAALSALSGPLFKLRERLIQSWSKKLAMTKEGGSLFRPTIFEILDRKSRENAHSNFLAYLFEQREMGSDFLRELVNEISTEEAQKIVGYLSDDSNISIQREVSLARKRLDILVSGSKFVIAIENKFYDRLHDVENNISQTEHYAEEIKKQYPGKTKLFILLDYKGEEESESYETIGYDVIERALARCKVGSGASRLQNQINEYLVLLRRLSMGLDQHDDIIAPDQLRLTELSTLIEMKI